METQDEVLFQITAKHLETGMRGFPVGYCTTSSVDPQKGLYYQGRPVSELWNWEPERVIYLLFFGEEPTDHELHTFKEEIKSRSKLSPEVKKQINLLPKHSHPMALFAVAIMILGMLEGKGDYREDSMNLIAKLPELVATLINTHAGWGNGNPSNPSLGYIENFVQMLQLPKKEVGLLRVMKSFYNLHLDHGGGNLSTFVGKAIASSKEDLYGCIAGAMNALAGPLHGRANQDALEFVQNVAKHIGEQPKAGAVEGYVRQLLANDGLVYGFGHAVLRVEDPRATVFYQLAQEMYPKHPLVKTALLLRTEGTQVLKENPKISNPYPNVDAMSGTLLTAAGFPFSEYYTVLFGFSRSLGISRQIIYERCEAREGKGTPIVRPKYLFKKASVVTTG